MKKFFSILFALALLLSGMRITIAEHYCGGSLVASKTSFSGKLATCGMENNENSCPLQGQKLSKHCCENRLYTAGTTNIFMAPRSMPEKSNRNNLILYFFTTYNLSQINLYISSLYTDFNPPGKFIPDAVSPEKICVFRI
jgi:hypothetical protein